MCIKRNVIILFTLIFVIGKKKDDVYQQGQPTGHFNFMREASDIESRAIWGMDFLGSEGPKHFYG